MKINLPSTLTHHSAWTLFFLTLLNIKQTEAGNGFRNCLVNKATNGGNNYDYLVTYFSKISILEGKTTGLCCGNSLCPNCCTACSVAAASDNFSCSKFQGEMYCNEKSSMCRGIVGSLPSSGLTNSGTCVASQTAAMNYINSVIPEGLIQGYAFATNQPTGLLCTWDNGCWICGDGVGCAMSWVQQWPGTAANNPMLVQPIQSTTTTASIGIITSSLSTSTQGSTTNSISTSTKDPILPSPTDLPADNHLVEKIAIPVGSISGTGIISFLTYYFCKKRKNQKKLMLENKLATENDNLEEHDVELDKKDKFLSERNDKSFIQSEQKIEFERDDKLENLTPRINPISSRITIINQLRTKLIGHEQLWSDYLEVDNLVVSNPNSQFIRNNFTNLQHQLLQLITLEEINLLLENNHSYRNNPHTEYTEIIENPLENNLWDNSYQSYYEEANSPQWIPTSNNPQQLMMTRNPEWRG